MVFRSLWTPPPDFQQDFTAEVSTRTHHFPTQQSDRSSSFPGTCHFRSSSHDTRGLTPQTQTPGRACGQTWPGATRAGHSHLWSQRRWLQEGAQLTQTSCCVPMATQVSCSSPSHFWKKKKDIGLMRKNPRVPTGCAELGQIFHAIAGTTHPSPAGKGSTQPCDGPRV